MPSGLPRRMGSSGWMMHAAARNAYYNRGSRAEWEQYVKERDAAMSAWATFIMSICGLIIAPFVVLLVAGMTLLYGPVVWLIPALICCCVFYVRSQL